MSRAMRIYLQPWWKRPLLCVLGIHDPIPHPSGVLGWTYCPNCHMEKVP